jgi:hypothetical protein
MGDKPNLKLAPPEGASVVEEEGIKALARLTVGYYRELLAEGLPPDEAMTLTKAWIQAIGSRPS